MEKLLKEAVKVQKDIGCKLDKNHSELKKLLEDKIADVISQLTDMNTIIAQIDADTSNLVDSNDEILTTLKHLSEQRINDVLAQLKQIDTVLDSIDASNDELLTNTKEINTSTKSLAGEKITAVINNLSTISSELVKTKNVATDLLSKSTEANAILNTISKTRFNDVIAKLIEVANEVIKVNSNVILDTTAVNNVNETNKKIEALTTQANADIKKALELLNFVQQFTSMTAQNVSAVDDTLGHIREDIRSLDMSNLHVVNSLHSMLKEQLEVLKSTIDTNNDEVKATITTVNNTLSSGNQKLTDISGEITKLPTINTDILTSVRNLETNSNTNTAPISRIDSTLYGISADVFDIKKYATNISDNSLEANEKIESLKLPVNNISSKSDKIFEFMGSTMMNKLDDIRSEITAADSSIHTLRADLNGTQDMYAKVGDMLNTITLFAPVVNGKRFVYIKEVYEEIKKLSTDRINAVISKLEEINASVKANHGSSSGGSGGGSSTVTGTVTVKDNDKILQTLKDIKTQISNAVVASINDVNTSCKAIDTSVKALGSILTNILNNNKEILKTDKDILKGVTDGNAIHTTNSTNVNTIKNTLATTNTILTTKLDAINTTLGSLPTGGGSGSGGGGSSYNYTTQLSGILEDLTNIQTLLTNVDTHNTAKIDALIAKIDKQIQQNTSLATLTTTNNTEAAKRLALLKEIKTVLENQSAPTITINTSVIESKLDTIIANQKDSISYVQEEKGYISIYHNVLDASGYTFQKTQDSNFVYKVQSDYSVSSKNNSNVFYAENLITDNHVIDGSIFYSVKYERSNVSDPFMIPVFNSPINIKSTDNSKTITAKILEYFEQGFPKQNYIMNYMFSASKDRLKIEGIFLFRDVQNNTAFNAILNVAIQDSLAQHANSYNPNLKISLLIPCKRIKFYDHSGNIKKKIIDLGKYHVYDGAGNIIQDYSIFPFLYSNKKITNPTANSTDIWYDVETGKLINNFI